MQELQDRREKIHNNLTHSTSLRGYKGQGARVRKKISHASI